MEKVATVEQRKSGKINWITVVPIVLFHILALGAIFTFSWANLTAFLIIWWLTGSVGIGLGFHRQLTHRGFQTRQHAGRIACRTRRISAGLGRLVGGCHRAGRRRVVWRGRRSARRARDARAHCSRRWPLALRRQPVSELGGNGRLRGLRRR